MRIQASLLVNIATNFETIVNAVIALKIFNYNF